MPSFADLRWPLHTERLLVRPTVPEDAAAIHGYRSRPEVVTYLGHDELTLREVTERLDDRAGRARTDAEHPVLDISALDRATGTLVGDGSIGLRSSAAARSRRAEVRLAEGSLGYCLSPTAQGRGLATELTRALLGVAFDGLGLRRVTATVYSEHLASRRVLEKAGMRREATFRAAYLDRDGRWLDDDTYALLRDEWSVAPG